MAKHSNLYLTNQGIMTANFLLLNQAQLSQLLKMMESYAWTAEMKGTLHFSDSHWSAVL